MQIPENLIFLRHGQSEANLLHKQEQSGSFDTSSYRDEILLRADWHHRLTKKGIQQSLLAGETIKRLYGGLSYFDHLYVSPYYRTRETAGLVDKINQDENQAVMPTARWELNDQLVDRSWGTDSQLSNKERRERFPESVELLHQTPWFAKYNNGENMLDVTARLTGFIDSLKQTNSNNVLAVTHEGPMSAARYIIEDMRPEEWERSSRDPEHAIRNATLLHYSRSDPHNKLKSQPYYAWRRMLYTDKLKKDSPDNGNWVKLDRRTRYTGAELLRQVGGISPIIID